MDCQLVFVHGRSQESKDGGALKREWIAALERGLAKSGLTLPIEESRIRFPYFGQTLFDIAHGVSEVDAARVVTRGGGDQDRNDFLRAVLEEVRRSRHIDDDAVEAELALVAREKGPLQWNWVRGLLQAIDRHLPYASGASIALATNDVYQYLRNPGIAGIIDEGVRQALQCDVRTVVVAHSLGTVVAYNLLARDGEEMAWRVPLFITLGSPLAVTAIHRAVRPISFPSCVGNWFNASDPKDVVALHPLDNKGFDVVPAIENKLDVQNHTSNHHGISGYLDNQEVARRIYEALTRDAP